MTAKEMQTAKDWIDKQPGPVQSYEKVPHTYLSEETGEMYCAQCGKTETTCSNRTRAFLNFMQQEQEFAKFTEKHLHGVKVQS